jgi:hypothetical protein
MTLRAARAAAFLLVAIVVLSASAACAKSAAPAVQSATAPTSDVGAPPPSAPTDGATLVLSPTGVTPTAVRVYQQSRVTFVNRDAVNHEIQSDPLHLHTDCPALNIGVIVPGQSRSSNPLPDVRACGFHDHTREADIAFYGTVFVDPR